MKTRIETYKQIIEDNRDKKKHDAHIVNIINYLKMNINNTILKNWGNVRAIRIEIAEIDKVRKGTRVYKYIIGLLEDFHVELTGDYIYLFNTKQIITKSTSMEWVNWGGKYGTWLTIERTYNNGQLIKTETIGQEPASQ